MPLLSGYEEWQQHSSLHMCEAANRSFVDTDFHILIGEYVMHARLDTYPFHNHMTQNFHTVIIL